MSGLGIRASGIAAAAPPRPPKILAPATVLFLMMVAHAILETARDALFLVRLGPDRLGWAYISIAATALLAVWSVRRFGRVRDARKMLAIFLITAVIGTTTLSVLLGESPWAAFVLYVWTGTIASLMVPSFWLVIERDVRIGDAKKVLGAIAAGGGFGALVGSAIASVMGTFLDAHHLVTAGAIVFGVAAASVRLLPAARPDGESQAGDTGAETANQSERADRTRRYAQLLVLLAVVSTVTMTIADMMFKRLMVERLPDDMLATVFGATYTGLNVVALLVQLAVTPRLIQRVGVGSALGLLPVLILTTTLGFVLTGAIIAVFALKLADGGMRNSVHRVISEILFVPMSNAVREKAKPLAEALGLRGGQAIAAGIALAIAADGNVTWSLAIATLSSSVLWLVVVAATRRAYVRRFRDTLEAAGIHREATIPVLDAEAIELLLETLASPDEREAMAALEMLAERGERIPALVLYHPSDAVVRHALSLLEGELRPDVARVLGQLTEHTDPQIRAAALAASSRTNLHLDQLVAALSDEEPDVRAAAAIGLATLNIPRHAEAVQRTLDELREGTVVDRTALAHAIARRPVATFAPLLLQLVAKREVPVTRKVLHAWELAPELADVERLLRMLEDPHVRGEARRVFLAGGEPFLARLLDALDDPRTPLGVRRHLPRTISRFGTAEAAAALVARLPRESDGSTEFKILRALGRMRADQPDLDIDDGPIRAYARRSTDDAVRYLRLYAALGLHRPAGELPGFDLLRELLAEKRQHASERVFRALGIIYPRDDMRSIHDALVSDQAEHRAAAREILEHLLPVDERVRLFEVVRNDTTSDIDVLREQFPTHSDVIATLLSDPSVSLRCVAAHHVAELQMVELRDELVRLKPVTDSPLVLNAFEQALARLHV